MTVSTCTADLAIMVVKIPIKPANSVKQSIVYNLFCPLFTADLTKVGGISIYFSLTSVKVDKALAPHPAHQD